MQSFPFDIYAYHRLLIISGSANADETCKFSLSNRVKNHICTDKSGYLHSQFAKLFYAIKRIMRLSEISINVQKH